MRTDDLVDSGGKLFGFTVSALEADRRSIFRVVQSIPNAKVTRKPKRFSLSKDEVFCEFEIDGEKFVATDPIGKSRFFWIGPEPVRHLPQTQKVRDAFRAEKASRLFRLLGALIGALLCVMGLLIITFALSTSSILPAIGSMILGGYFIYFGVTGSPFLWSLRGDN